MTTDSSARVRALGLVTMLGAPAILAEAARHGFQTMPNEQTDALGAVLYALFSVGWLAAVVALRSLGAAGRGRWGRALGVLPIVTVSLAIGQSAMDLLRVPVTNPLYVVTDLAWPLSMVLTFALSVVALFQRHLTAGLRLAPLACGISLPVAIVMIVLTGSELPQWLFAWHTALGWFALGLAIFTSGPSADATGVRASARA